jgi:hypothetical protein
VLDIIGDLKSSVATTVRAAVWGMVAAICAVVGVLFLLIAAFLWLAARYDVLTACVVMGGAFVVIAAGAGAAFALTRRRAEVRAKERRARAALDPAVLAGALQVAGLIGSRRSTLLLVVALASGFLLSAMRSSASTDDL